MITVSAHWFDLSSSLDYCWLWLTNRPTRVIKDSSQTMHPKGFELYQYWRALMLLSLISLDTKFLTNWASATGFHGLGSLLSAVKRTIFWSERVKRPALTCDLHSLVTCTHLGPALTWDLHSLVTCTHLGPALTCNKHSLGDLHSLIDLYSLGIPLHSYHDPN